VKCEMMVKYVMMVKCEIMVIYIYVKYELYICVIECDASVYIINDHDAMCYEVRLCYGAHYEEYGAHYEEYDAIMSTMQL
jgi:hypothetical protein